MQMLEKYKILSGEKGWNQWLQTNGLIIGYDYPCIGFTQTAGTLPAMIHLIVKDRIVTASYTADRFELVK